MTADKMDRSADTAFNKSGQANLFPMTHIIRTIALSFKAKKKALALG